jgi:glutathione S-transferase
LTRHYSSLADALVTTIFPFIALDILERIADRDREYFRTSREQRIGKTLEAFVANRDAGLAGFRASLAPLRATLKAQPFFGGDEPLYADYALFGQFQWARCISPFALLEDGDPARLWRDRLLDCFDGLARKAVAYDV